MSNITAIVFAAVAAAVITGVLGFAVIPWLRKLKFGQTILDDGPVWHKSKQGTPTMGGIMFIAGTVLAAVLVAVTDKITGGSVITAGTEFQQAELKTKFWAGLIMAVSFGFIGFVDDYIKVVKKRNLGLTIKQKTLFQTLVCVAYLLSIWLGRNHDTAMFIPFAGSVDFGFLWWIIGIIIMYAAINAVNFTDGIDGLCTSVTLTFAISMAAIAALRGLFGFSMLAAALGGGCIGFLVWNHNPAKVFMGDTGSLFLGGMVIALAYAIDCPLILVLTGIIYVIEGASDVIQIGYFKLTHGKRIFKMAPIHHHFEMSGWSEKKIVAVFTTVNLIGGALAFALMYFGKYRA
ncbi:MAG: phospho-N-acetylmuramoyl-pentapeptide-transferase [Clostridia bacterium]|nr:phospho-N-acetylmuramoyl-pentapeptide-transferase [Clostridia bacterium]